MLLSLHVFCLLENTHAKQFTSATHKTSCIPHASVNGPTESVSGKEMLTSLNPYERIFPVFAGCHKSHGYAQDKGGVYQDEPSSGSQNHGMYTPPEHHPALRDTQGKQQQCKMSLPVFSRWALTLWEESPFPLA